MFFRFLDLKRGGEVNENIFLFIPPAHPFSHAQQQQQAEIGHVNIQVWDLIST